MSTDCAIQVFTRAPVPGDCKTRLIPRHGPRGAARWHRRLTERTLATARSSPADVEVWGSPDLRHPMFGSLRQRGVPLHRQHGTDLGARMRFALNDAGRRGYPLRVLVGTDCPALTPAHLTAAMQALREGTDCVLQAATDGGFVMIGSRVTLPPFALGTVDWSSGRELRQTIRRLRHCGLSTRIFDALDDVDHPDDLRRARRARLI